MFFANYILKDKVSRINKQLKDLNSKSDLAIEKGKCYGFIYDIILALEELYISTQTYDYKTSIDELYSILNDIKAAQDVEAFTLPLERIKARFDNYNYQNMPNTCGNYNNYNINRHCDPLIAEKIIERININRKINIFDTKSRDGKIFDIAKKINENILCYGLEDTNSYLKESKKYADKMIKGQIKGSRISNDAFDLLIANCPIGFSLSENMSFGGVQKVEKIFIQNVLNYVSKNGLILITIPFYRLHKDTCAFISRNIKNAQIFRTKHDTSKVYILGIKDKKKSVDEEIYNLLRRSYRYDNVDYFDENTLPEHFNISSIFTPVEIFKGSELDVDELHDIVKNSGCMEAFFEKQSVEKISNNTKRPLLPFNVGQIGLVLTSGCLDGVIDEGDGYKHLVKGRVSKKSEVTKDIEDGIVSEREVISNKVEINIILPNGDFITLT